MNTSFEFLKYGLSSIFTYAFIFGGTYFLTDIIGLKANISYLIILTTAYIFTYLLGATFIFSKNINSKSGYFFIWYVLIFWSLNNLVFNVLFKSTDIHYLLIVIINIAVFAPLRFLALKFFVFKN